ncbi:MAG: hypothetical protein RLZZ352_18 [Pseudomonadota bacterium]|jgi:PAS domain S-box-containing protein
MPPAAASKPVPTDRQQLEDSERRLRYVLEATGEGIWDWDMDSDIVSHNRRWCDILGLDDAFLQHSLATFSALLHPEDAPAVMARLQSGLQGDGRFESEHRLCRPDGTVVWVQDRGAVVERDAQGHPRRMVGSVRDITTRKQAQAQIEEHAEQLRAIFEISPDGFVTFDEARRVKSVNPALLQLTGEAAERLQGLDEQAFAQRLNALCKPQTPFPALATLRDALPTANKPAEGVRRYLIELEGTPTRVLEVRLRLSNLPEVSQILYVRDVTHEAEIERLKNKFMTMAAHELRNPMASIYGFAEILHTHALNEDERQEFLDIIYRQSDLMMSILNELLDLARIEARGAQDLVLEAVPVQVWVREVVARFNPPDGRARPRLRMPTRPLFMRADQRKASQALMNLLSNAYKYSSAPEPVSIRVQTEDDGVLLVVQDQGIGLTTDQLAQLGTPFYRCDTSGRVPGTGLGLSIVREIMKLHQGRWQASSTPGQGTQMALWFPVSPPPPTPASTAPAAPV